MHIKWVDSRYKNEYIFYTANGYILMMNIKVKIICYTVSGYIRRVSNTYWDLFNL